MDNIYIKMADDGSLNSEDTNSGYIEEYCAKQIVISLNSLFKSDIISYYTISFEPYGLGKKIVTDNIYKDFSDGDIFYSAGSIYCPLYDYITVAPTVTVQVDGYETDFNGDITGIYKSGLIDLKFSPSLTGKGIIPDFTNGDLKLYDRIEGVVEEKLGQLIIDGEKLTDGCVTESKLAINSVSSEKIKPTSITASKLASGCVTSDKISTGSVTGDKIPSLAISSNHLKNNSVTTDKLNFGSITSAKLASYSVTQTKLATNSVTKEKIAPSSIDNSRLCDNSITSSKIINGAITTDKLSSASVDSSKLATNSVTKEKIAPSSIDNSRLCDNAVSSSKIINGAVTTDKLSSASVDSSKLTDNSVTSEKICDKSVTTSKMADKSITPEKLSEKYLTQSDLDLAFEENSLDAKFKEDADNIRSLSVTKIPLEHYQFGYYISSSTSGNYVNFMKYSPVTTQNAVCCLHLPVRFNRTYSIDIDFSPIAELLQNTGGTIYPFGHNNHMVSKIIALSKKTENGFEYVGSKSINHHLVVNNGEFIINDSASCGRILAKFKIDDTFFKKYHENVDFSNNIGKFVDDELLYISFNLLYITSPQTKITEAQWNEARYLIDKSKIYFTQENVLSEIEEVNENLNSILSLVVGSDT